MVGKSARFLAPIALASVALGIYLLVHSALAPRVSGATSTSTSTAIVNGRRRVRRTRPGPKYYVVRSGDTLSAIAARTRVGLSRLASLNPSVTPPYNLQTGQRLRLRR